MMAQLFGGSKLWKELLREMNAVTKMVMLLVLTVIAFAGIARGNPRPGKTVSFNKDWRFHLGDFPSGQEAVTDDSQWRGLNLPHDWSIEGEFDEKNPATTGGGALPGGIGWYRKAFALPATARDQLVFVEFDGVYRNSEVWINGHYLGKRPYGYSSFRYELTSFLKFDGQKNLIAVKVDNSQQPNSRWYSGSGIYRNVWLTTTNKVFVDHWGTFVTTPDVNPKTAKVHAETKISNNTTSDQNAVLTTIIYSPAGKEISRVSSSLSIAKSSVLSVAQDLAVGRPSLWSVDSPTLYRLFSQVTVGRTVVDQYETPFGILRM